MEKTLYDTNRLIEAYRKKEKIKGYTTIYNIIEFPKALEFDLTVLYPSKEDYNLAIKISTELIKKGKPIPAIDTMISAIAINKKLKLATYNKHFQYIQEIIEDFKTNT